MSEKDVKKDVKDDEDIKEPEGELDADVLDGAFDDQGFGDEDQDEIDTTENDALEEESAEWLTHDDRDNW